MKTILIICKTRSDMNQRIITKLGLQGYKRKCQNIITGRNKTIIYTTVFLACSPSNRFEGYLFDEIKNMDLLDLETKVRLNMRLR